MLMVNAIIFMLPNQVWKVFEGGRISTLCNEKTQSDFVAENHTHI